MTQENQNASTTAEAKALPDSAGSHPFAKLGLSAQEMTGAMNRMAKVARKVPFPRGEELRQILLAAWKREWGIFRFLIWGYWMCFFSENERNNHE
jgi:hypothetical protein